MPEALVADMVEPDWSGPYPALRVSWLGKAGRLSVAALASIDLDGRSFNAEVFVDSTFAYLREAS